MLVQELPIGQYIVLLMNTVFWYSDSAYLLTSMLLS